jgi:hypothetical protein
MKTAIDFIGMTMILLLGVIVILGVGIVIAFECRLINRMRRPEPPQLELAPYRPFETTRRR